MFIKLDSHAFLKKKQMSKKWVEKMNGPASYPRLFTHIGVDKSCY